MANHFFKIENRAGEALTVNGTVITPYVRSLQVRLPGRHGGLVWSVPVAVRVGRPSGAAAILPVRDVTRQVQIGLLAMSLMTSLAIGAVWLALRLLARRRGS